MLQLLAAFGVLVGNQLARWVAVAVVGLNAIDHPRQGEAPVAH
jgi:hypothetical protein